MGDCPLNQDGDSLDQVPGKHCSRSRECCRVVSGPAGQTVCTGRSAHSCFSIFCPRCFLLGYSFPPSESVQRKRLTSLTSVHSAWPVPLRGDMETQLPYSWVSGQKLGVTWDTSIKVPPPRLPVPMAGPAHPLKSP